MTPERLAEIADDVNSHPGPMALNGTSTVYMDSSGVYEICRGEYGPALARFKAQFEHADSIRQTLAYVPELLAEVKHLGEELANLRGDYEVARDANEAFQAQRDSARSEVGRLRKAFVQIGWYCWRCHKVNPTACKSGDVPVFARTEDATEIEQDMAEYGGQP